MTGLSRQVALSFDLNSFGGFNAGDSAAHTLSSCIADALLALGHSQGVGERWRSHVGECSALRRGCAFNFDGTDGRN
jgi:hypothetical protein